MPSVQCPANLRFRCIPINSGETGVTLSELAAFLNPLLVSTIEAIIVDRKAQGTDGGTFNNGAWRTRDLNTIISDPTSLIISLATNQVTIPAGRYVLTANGPARAVTNHMSRIFNVTLATVFETGQSVQCGSIQTGSVTVGEGVFLTDTVLEVQQRSVGNSANNGFGSASNFPGTPETYTQLFINRIGNVP